MSKAKQIKPKPLVVESVAVRLSDGRAFEIKSRDIEALCVAGFRRMYAYRMGRPARKTRFDRELKLLEATAPHNPNLPILAVVTSVFRSETQKGWKR